jgi:hypothetical protein
MRYFYIIQFDLSLELVAYKSVDVCNISKTILYDTLVLSATQKNTRATGYFYYMQLLSAGNERTTLHHCPQEQMLAFVPISLNPLDLNLNLFSFHHTFFV